MEWNDGMEYGMVSPARMQQQMTYYSISKTIEKA